MLELKGKRSLVLRKILPENSRDAKPVTVHVDQVKVVPRSTPAPASELGDVTDGPAPPRPAGADSGPVSAQPAPRRSTRRVHFA